VRIHITISSTPFGEGGIFAAATPAAARFGKHVSMRETAGELSDRTVVAVRQHDTMRPERIDRARLANPS
jgi:hypothetical protein